MADLVVRLYNVRFGDAILVSIPDEEAGSPVERHILFDFGNALSRDGGADAVLVPVVDDLLARLGGAPLDLYVMTHEHLDHVQGLFYAAEAHGKVVAARQAWLTGSAAPDYYETHPDARRKRLAALAAYRLTAARLPAASSASPILAALLATNDTRSTRKCVDYLRDRLTPAGGVHYVDRTTDLSALQPASSATVRLLAPEEDTSDYYRSFTAFADGLGLAGDEEADDLDLGLGPDPEAAAPEPVPPRGVDAGAFYNLLGVRHGNAASTLLSIDRAANNTSIVLLLEWKGWRLLFTGDAEKSSWRRMAAGGLVEPVHFLKISHHGSETGMPPPTVLDALLPVPAPGVPRARAAVSTFAGSYPGVPNDLTLAALRERADVLSTADLAAGELFRELRFADTGPPA
jgi:beta-lactamase superfamily II metal-dependent hydrolase